MSSIPILSFASIKLKNLSHPIISPVVLSECTENEDSNLLKTLPFNPSLPYGVLSSFIVSRLVFIFKAQSTQ